MEMKYKTLNWDDDWSAVVEPYFIAWATDKPIDRLEAVYDSRYVGSADCRPYAVRVLEILKERHPKYVFAAHTDITAHPPNSYWRIVVRSPGGKPVRGADLGKLQAAAKAIYRNVAAKYPGAAEAEQAAAHAQAANDVAQSPKPRGCLMRLLWPLG